MTRIFKNQSPKCREVYTSPYDLIGLAKIISNSIDKYDRWRVYIAIGNPGNYILGPYKVELDMRNGLWRIQSAETIHDFHTGNSYTEEEGELLDSSVESIYMVLKKVKPQ